MKLKDLIESKIIKDSTELWIWNYPFPGVIHGKWFEDKILKFLERNIESFTYNRTDDVDVYLR